MLYKFTATLFLSIAVAAACRAGETAISGKLAGVFPEKIKCVAVLTPASAPVEKNARRGISLMEKAGIKVKVMPYTFEKSGKGPYSGPSLEHRIEAWNQAVNDPEVDMIIPTRGGSGAQELIKHIDWKKFRERKLILMGYSNITYITSAMLHHNAGYPIAGPNVSSLVSTPAKALAHLKTVLAGKDIPQIRLVPLKKGDACGKVYAGHMKFLNEIDAGKWKVDTAGKVVFIECIRRDTGYYNQIFDQMLKRGFFDKVSAVVFCHFVKLKDQEKVDAMFDSWAAKLNCPVYKGYPYGHHRDNYALDFSRTAVIKDDVITFK